MKGKFFISIPIQKIMKLIENRTSKIFVKYYQVILKLVIGILVVIIKVTVISHRDTHYL